jgi:hypothetical protein
MQQHAGSEEELRQYLRATTDSEMLQYVRTQHPVHYRKGHEEQLGFARDICYRVINFILCSVLRGCITRCAPATSWPVDFF